MYAVCVQGRLLGLGFDSISQALSLGRRQLECHGYLNLKYPTDLGPVWVEDEPLYQETYPPLNGSILLSVHKSIPIPSTI